MGAFNAIIAQRPNFPNFGCWPKLTWTNNTQEPIHFFENWDKLFIIFQQLSLQVEVIYIILKGTKLKTPHTTNLLHSYNTSYRIKYVPTQRLKKIHL